MGKSASFTGLKVSCPVNVCLNQNYVKCHFWCAPAHKRAKPPSESKSRRFAVFSSFYFQPLRALENPSIWEHWKYEFSIQALTVNSFDAIFRILGHICQWRTGMINRTIMLPIRFLPAVQPRMSCVQWLQQSLERAWWTCHDYRVPCHYSSK